ncbi:hypothetical protein B296_00000540 [Ensete ventricosum]|uniref:Uncharacterized protein n=1 Tax=Ensete ventricosum TaxID=4639 RepID=A0A427AH30_ENSVE|nr:hypothetical protein B296_00000540 [Ensete ventricosum]
MNRSLRPQRSTRKVETRADVTLTTPRMTAFIRAAPRHSIGVTVRVAATTLTWLVKPMPTPSSRRAYDENLNVHGGGVDGRADEGKDSTKQQDRLASAIFLIMSGKKVWRNDSMAVIPPSYNSITTIRGIRCQENTASVP